MNITIQEQKENVIIWLNALLSGNYKQAKNKLGNSERGYCCWGLACSLLKLNYNPETGWDYRLFEYIGFNNKNAVVLPKLNNKKDLASFNDAIGLDFKEIAAYLIEYSYNNFSPEISVYIDEYYENNEEVKDLITHLKNSYKIEYYEEV